MEIDVEMRKKLESSIPGWGVDRQPESRPAYPKEKVPPQGTGAHWQSPEQQVPSVKIHKSIERPSLTPVFGTTLPPKALSGRLRDFAYRFGEGRMSHWMVLLLADRVDMVESLVGDLFRGQIPRPIREMGLRAERHRDQRSTGVWVAGAVAVGVGIYALLRMRARPST